MSVYVFTVPKEIVNKIMDDNDKFEINCNYYTLRLRCNGDECDVYIPINTKASDVAYAIRTLMSALSSKSLKVNAYPFRVSVCIVIDKGDI